AAIQSPCRWSDRSPARCESETGWTARKVRHGAAEYVEQVADHDLDFFSRVGLYAERGIARKNNLTEVVFTAIQGKNGPRCNVQNPAQRVVSDPRSAGNLRAWRVPAHRTCVDIHRRCCDSGRSGCAADVHLGSDVDRSHGAGISINRHFLDVDASV